MINPDETGRKFCELLEIIDRLRNPGGCPWDQKQTIQTFKPYLLEETHELIEAVDNNDLAQIKEELGDMFFQLGFINRLYEEKKLFSIEEVLQSIIDKMIRRHPHVFEGRTFQSYDEMRKNWALVKEQENNSKKSKPCGIDVPKSLPALVRGQKVSSRAARTGCDWPDIPSILEKIRKELPALADNVREGDKDKIGNKLGDFLFLLVNLGRKCEINSEECLKQATNRFIKRFNQLEDCLPSDKSSTRGFNRRLAQQLWEETEDHS